MADGEISSANVVGYTTKAVTAGNYYLVATQFDKASEGTGSIDMNDLISLSSDIAPGLYDDDFATAPQILVLKPSGVGYNKYYYISDGTDDKDEELGYNAWCDVDGYELTSAAKLQIGKGFWFYSPVVSGTITTAGQVTEEASKTLSFTTATYGIVCNPYPKAVEVNDLFSVTGLTGVDWTFTTEEGDTLAIWDQDAQAYMVTLYYAGDTASADMADNGAEPGTWFDMDSYGTATTEIPAGGAFWIQSSGAGTLTFK